MKLFPKIEVLAYQSLPVKGLAHLKYHVATTCQQIPAGPRKVIASGEESHAVVQMILSDAMFCCRTLNVTERVSGREDVHSSLLHHLSTSGTQYVKTKNLKAQRPKGVARGAAKILYGCIPNTSTKISSGWKYRSPPPH